MFGACWTRLERSAFAFLLGFGAVASSQAALETAGELLVNFDASALTPGSTVTTLDAVRSFTASGSPTVGSYTTNGVTVTALTFDGVDDYLLSSAVGSGVVTNQPFSVEAWVLNPAADATSGAESVFSWGAAVSGSDLGAAFVFNGTGQAALLNTESVLFHNDSALAPNQWHHVAVVYSGSPLASHGEFGVVMIYADGVLNRWYPVSQSGVNYGWPNKGEYVLGARKSSSGAATALFSGALAKLRFHSGALTPLQVRANYAAEHGGFPTYSVGSSLESPGAVVLDLDASGLPGGALSSWSGNVTQALVQATSSAQPTVGTVGGVKAVSFDGNDWLEVSGVDARITGGSTPFTIETYIYNPGVADEESYFCWAPRNDGNGKGRSVSFGSNGSYGAASYWYSDLGFGTVPSAGAWHHIVTTYDGSTMRVYVDGALNNTKSMTLNNATGVVYSIGRASDIAHGNMVWFSGSIARLRACVGALAAWQIYNNYIYLNRTIGGNGTSLIDSAYGGSGSYSALSDLAGVGDYRAAVVQLGGSASLSLGADETVARLGVTDGASVSVASGKTLTVTDRVLVGGASANAATGTLTVAGNVRSMASAATAPRYTFSVGLNGVGNMAIASGAAVTLVNATEFWVGHGTNGYGKLTVNGALTNNSWFVLGRFGGLGEMAIDGGQVVCNGTFSMGEMADSTSLTLKNGGSCSAWAWHVGKFGGSATVDARSGSTVTAGSMILNFVADGSSAWEWGALHFSDSTLVLGSGGVTTKSLVLAPYLSAEATFSNSTLRASASSCVTVPLGFLGSSSTLATAGYSVSLRDVAYGDSLTTSGGGTANLLPKSALSGTVTVNGGTLNVENVPYRWLADDLNNAHSNAVTSWVEENYESAASQVAWWSSGPLMVTNAVNGHKAVRFNADALRQLQISDRLNPLAGAEAATIAVVFKPYANGYASGLGAWWGSSLFIGGEVSGSANDWGFIFSQDGRIGLSLCQVSALGAMDLMQYHATPAALNAYHVALCAWQPGKIALNLDGDESVNPTVYTAQGGSESGGSLPNTLEGVTLPRADSTLYMGSGTADQSHCFNGEIAEIRIYKNQFMDRYARQSLVRDLANDYGLSAVATAAAAAMGTPTYAADLAALNVSTNAVVPAAAAVWSAESLALGDGATVSAWNDSVASRPASGSAVYVASGIGGKPAVCFAGSPLTVEAGNNPVNGSQQFTAAAVFQAATSYASSDVNWWNGGGLLGNKISASENGSDWGLALVNGRIVAGAGAQAARTYNYDANYTISLIAKSKPRLDDGKPHVVIYRWSNNGAHAVSVDGIAFNLNNVGYARAGQALQIGGTMGGNGFSGLISEVRIYGARLTDAQEAVLGRELADKYGVRAAAYGAPKALPGATLALNSAVLSTGVRYCDPALSTIQSNQTVMAAGTSSVDGVLCVGAGATLALPSVTDSLTVGNLALQSGSTLKWKHESKTSTPIHVTGDLALPARFTLDLTGSSGNPSRITTLIAYDGSATVPAEGVKVDVVGATKAGTKAVVVPSEKRVVLMSPSGAIVLVK